MIHVFVTSLLHTDLTNFFLVATYNNTAVHFLYFQDVALIELKLEHIYHSFVYIRIILEM